MSPQIYVKILCRAGGIGQGMPGRQAERRKMTLQVRTAAKWNRALLLYPSQAFCSDPGTRPVVIRTQLLKLYSYLRTAGVPRAAARSAVYEGGLLHGPIADHVYAGQVAVFWTGGVRSGLAGLAGTVVRSRQGFPLAPAGS